MVKQQTGSKRNLAFVAGNIYFTETKVSSQQALKYLHGIFHFMGLLSTQKYKSAYILYALFIHGSFTIFLPFSFIASYFSKANQNIEYDSLLFSIQVVINVFGGVLKISMLLFYMPNLLMAEDIFAIMDARCESQDEIGLLYKLQKLGRKLIVNYCVIFWSYAISTYISSMLAGHPPYSLFLPYINWRNSRWEFFVASFIEFFLMSGSCFQQVANDSYGAMYVCVLRAHINILRSRVSKLAADLGKSLAENENELKMCIKDHQNIIIMYNTISPVISSTIFLQFLNSTAILGLTLINILIFAKDFTFKVASSVYFFAVIVEIFPLCYYANLLYCDCELLNFEIFHSKWMDQNKCYRKMLIFFMQRSQQSMELMAAKIIPINLNSFISIAKFSFSLYTLIKKMNLKERLGYQ